MGKLKEAVAFAFKPFISQTNQRELKTSKSHVKPNGPSTVDQYDTLKDRMRRKENTRKLKKCGSEIEVKLKKAAIEENERAIQKIKLEERRLREEAAIRKKQESLEEKRQAAKGSRQMSNLFKSLKSCGDINEWPHSNPELDKHFVH